MRKRRPSGRERQQRGQRPPHARVLVKLKETRQRVGDNNIKYADVTLTLVQWEQHHGNGTLEILGSIILGSVLKD